MGKNVTLANAGPPNPKPAPGLELYTPDEVAETLEGISAPTCTKLWNLLGTMTETKPLGGDGSDGTVEWPEPTEAAHSVVAIWKELTPAERAEINAAFLAEEELLEVRLASGWMVSRDLEIVQGMAVSGFTIEEAEELLTKLPTIIAAAKAAKEKL